MQNANILPAGLMDKNVEFFNHGPNVHASYNGSVVHVKDLPMNIKAIIEADMDNNPLAYTAAIDFGKTNALDAMEQYIWCRFGGFDKVPDLLDGKMHEPEYHECGKRGSCKYEGKLCSAIKVENGFLTKREIEILQMIARGFEDKIIADKLGIATKTINAHKSNISLKTGLHNKVEMGVYASKKGLI